MLRLACLTAGLAMLVTACYNADNCPINVPAIDPVETIDCQSVYTGSGNPYALGELAVTTQTIYPGQFDAPFETIVHSPVQPGFYPVVYFQHGFFMHTYSATPFLRHLASHGFVAVAPTLHVPGPDLFNGCPPPWREVEMMREAIDWLDGRLDGVTGVGTCPERLGIIGHSRGGTTAWMLAAQMPGRFRALMAMDPDDRTGGLELAAAGNVPAGLPVLITGTDLPNACAAVGNNHDLFWPLAPGPAWLVIAPGQGHTDMLDPGTDDFALGRSVCLPGANPDGMRLLMAGMMSAFFRGTLQDDPAALDWLTDTANAPVAIWPQSK